jgi:hypothetical protein
VSDETRPWWTLEPPPRKYLHGPADWEEPTVDESEQEDDEREEDEDKVDRIEEQRQRVVGP